MHHRQLSHMLMLGLVLVPVLAMVSAMVLVLSIPQTRSPLHKLCQCMSLSNIQHPRSTSAQAALHSS